MELVIINQPRVFPCQRGYEIAKRMIDLAICLLALPVVLPLMAICAFLIRMDSPGPVLFVQERVGRGGWRFQLYKFRTMHYNLDDSSHRTFMKAFVNGQVGGKGDRGKNGTFRSIKTSTGPLLGSNGNGRIYKPVHISQLTRVGRILRKTSVDELPQILNVLKGEMSLVGPRPNVPWEVEEYRGWHHERLEVLPGITGLAQVRGRSGISFDSIVKYDIEYIENRSLMLDLKILSWTVAAVLCERGAS